MIDPQTRQRLAMTVVGALAGIALFGLGEMTTRGVLGERATMAGFALALVFFTGLLGMAGALRLRRAALVSAALAVGVALLLFWASFRYEEPRDFANGPGIVLAGLVLTFVPMPFAVAALTTGWRHYPTLFSEAWGIVIRYAAAWLFVGLVWLVLYASDMLLRGVGLNIIGAVLEMPMMGFLLTGAVLGLAIAVVDEMADVVSPYLVLRLLRLLLPPVLLVVVIFVLALPFSGTVRLFGALSAAATLLGMAALGATLATAALDQTEEEATRSALVRRCAQGMALLLIAPAALGAWAVWLRVGQYGWTPDRVFAACIAALGLGYGVLYLAAVLRGTGWEARIRQANITMALVMLALSAAQFTPLLNPEAIAARSQLARFETGKIPAAQLDLADFDRWGKAGAAARARLEALALEPGQEALARRLSTVLLAEDSARAPELDENAMRAGLAADLPLRPEGAIATRDSVLQMIGGPQLQDWQTACQTRMADGRPACVMVVADLWPDFPGDEVVLAGLDTSGFLMSHGFSRLGDSWQWHDMRPLTGRPARPDSAEAQLRAMQDNAVPRLRPVPGFVLDLPGDALMLAR
ncbi:DUF4153 domain-containing protein [Gemmobacter serpentinus]|uniref:DUF4153 domain-containing protein n=1 Tax=Gemmobacter serpentinus TaxID=2652247 RepID=UPI00124C2AC3|nr:DUF4153 domain-containing protein [Gemmobacter serpentinus]